MHQFQEEEVESEDKRESNQRPRRAAIHNVTVLRQAEIMSLLYGRLCWSSCNDTFYACARVSRYSTPSPMKNLRNLPIVFAWKSFIEINSAALTPIFLLQLQVLIIIRCSNYLESYVNLLRKKELLSVFPKYRYITDFIKDIITTK